MCFCVKVKAEICQHLSRCRNKSKGHTIAHKRKWEHLNSASNFTPPAGFAIIFHCCSERSLCDGIWIQWWPKWLSVMYFQQNESCPSCPQPPSSYEERREQGRQLSFWWNAVNLIGHYRRGCSPIASSNFYGFSLRSGAVNNRPRVFFANN